MFQSGPVAEFGLFSGRFDFDWPQILKQTALKCLNDERAGPLYFSKTGGCGRTRWTVRSSRSIWKRIPKSRWRSSNWSVSVSRTISLFVRKQKNDQNHSSVDRLSGAAVHERRHTDRETWEGSGRLHRAARFESRGPEGRDSRAAREPNVAQRKRGERGARLAARLVRSELLPALVQPRALPAQVSRLQVPRDWRVLNTEIVFGFKCSSTRRQWHCYLCYRHASDYAYDGYKAYIQHKLLQSILPEPALPRNYPPCLLEWKAARKHANMAVEAIFPDGRDPRIFATAWHDCFMWKRDFRRFSEESLEQQQPDFRLFRTRCLDFKSSCCLPYVKQWRQCGKRKCFWSGEKAVGPVDSWTTGEAFASHLLQCRYR